MSEQLGELSIASINNVIRTKWTNPNDSLINGHGRSDGRPDLTRLPKLPSTPVTCTRPSEWPHDPLMTSRSVFSRPIPPGVAVPNKGNGHKRVDNQTNKQQSVVFSDSLSTRIDNDRGLDRCDSWPTGAGYPSIGPLLWHVGIHPLLSTDVLFHCLFTTSS